MSDELVASMAARHLVHGNRVVALVCPSTSTLSSLIHLLGEDGADITSIVVLESSTRSETTSKFLRGIVRDESGGTSSGKFALTNGSSVTLSGHEGPLALDSFSFPEPPSVVVVGEEIMIKNLASELRGSFLGSVW